MENKKIKLLAVVGPTAGGKSALALELARRYGGEIISCDSMQIYKRMDIGTAKPTVEEMAQVPHHMIDIVEPDCAFSSEDYVRFASERIADCSARGVLPIVCGGTGLYLDALLRGGNSAPISDTSALRTQLCERVEKEGIEPLYRELQAVDPESAEAIHPNNTKRVIRAMEIYLSTGTTKSELDRLSRQMESPYDFKVVGLFYKDREVLYKRIEKRVDIMIEQGLLDETKSLMDEGVFITNRTAAQAIGYKELLGYVQGDMSLDDAVEELKKATRRYAKRQMTWFSAKEYVQPLYADLKTFEEIVNNACQLFSLS